VRWARNHISTSGDVQDIRVKVNRDLNGAQHGAVLINETSDVALVAAARRAERLAKRNRQSSQWDMISWYPLEPMTHPQLFNAETSHFEAAQRAEAAVTLMQQAQAAGMLSAGYIEVTAHSLAMIDTLGHVQYFPYTTASYSVTVRDTTGTGSGWAGADEYDWTKIDASKLSAVALDKCLKSRNPVAVEPGRYTTVLEPQAVCDFIGQLVFGSWQGGKPLSKDTAEAGRGPFFNKVSSTIGGQSVKLETPKIGERIVDERITISADPMDPELGFPPFEPSTAWNFFHVWENDWINRDVFHPVTWIKDGVLTSLAYYRDIFLGNQAEEIGGQGNGGRGLPNSGAFRMSGGTTSVDEMVATTKRGLLVTRFDRVQGLDADSLLSRGYTRDGLWLIENGKISKPVKNLMFVESILFALNNLDQLGLPQRVYHPPRGRLLPPQPVIVPSIKVRDFSFTALADAV
jgi:predicted Zn-dependent protease